MEKIFVVSKEALESFVNMFPELKEKSELRYNVIDSRSILKMAEEPVEPIRTDGEKTIVTLGRLSDEKGQDIVPRVAKRLKCDNIKFKWYLIGDGRLHSKIRKLSKDLEVEDEVVLLGKKVNPYPYLKQADLYVQTSIHEGYCITLGEAKVFDIPIISTNVAGAYEQLNEYQNSAVVYRDEDSLLLAIKEFIA